MLSSLFISHTVNAVTRALESADIGGGADGAIAVLAQPRLARALAERGHRVVCTATSPRPLRRIHGERICCRPDSLPLADDHLAAVVASGAGQSDDWSALLAEWSRVTRDGGALILLDRAAPTELTRRAMCGGLAAIEQRQAGRTVVTSGVVSKL